MHFQISPFEAKAVCYGCTPDPGNVSSKSLQQIPTHWRCAALALPDENPLLIYHTLSCTETNVTEHPRTPRFSQAAQVSR